MRYFRGTSKLSLTISANGSGILKLLVDASFAVHPNMRGHSVEVLSLDRRFPIVSSTKHNINTRIYTETELLDVDNIMPFSAQGYNVRDNQEWEGLDQQKKKHINICYFFITDRFKNSEVSVVWWPKGDMIGNYMTKPLQGAMFSKFRYQIMAVIPAADTGPGKFKIENLRKA